MKNNIMISVICNTYNQESYIREAIESFLSQKTNFEFEVLIHDDASTDSTPDIIREYEQRFPEIIKPIYQTENQYSKNVNISIMFQYPRAKGKYLAICEGDDYWIDHYKLQKQFDALEKNMNINICTCCTLKVKNGRIIGKVAPADCNSIFTPEEVIMGGGGFVGTNSIVLRKDAFIGNKLYGKVFGLDYFTQIIGSMDKGMLYLSDCMCAYRVSSIGSWSRTMLKNNSARVLHSERVIESLEIMDRLLDEQYHDVVQKMIYNIKLNNLIRTNNFKEMRKEPFLSIYKKKPFVFRFKVRLKQFLAILKVR